MSKGDKRRPGTGYAEGFDRIFRRPVKREVTPAMREAVEDGRKVADEVAREIKNLRDEFKF